jgi:hypothetical protein
MISSIKVIILFYFNTLQNRISTKKISLFQSKHVKNITTLIVYIPNLKLIFITNNQDVRIITCTIFPFRVIHTYLPHVGIKSCHAKRYSKTLNLT